MKFNFDLSEKNVKIQLEENKELFISLSILGASILLFVIFIFPNILSFPGKLSERNVETEKLDQIKKAKAVLENVNKETLDSDLEIVNRSLPSDKNFELVLNSISQAATKSNVVIEGYKFKDDPRVKKTNKGEFNSVVFEIEIEGEISKAADFVKELSSIFPVSEAREIEYDNDVSTVTVAFYFKPFTEVNARDVALARDKTSDEAKTLKIISSWESFTAVPSPIEEIPLEGQNTEEATSSAEEL